MQDEKLEDFQVSSEDDPSNNDIDVDKIEKVNLGKTMKSSFLNYAMSVIVSRALPDARDGLKPVQRRILYGMNELNLYANSPFKKSARIVGDVMGKYHPHGDSSIYEAMVRMAQDFSYRYTLVNGHGNFGSIDGDGAAAMRYTEARMSKMSMELLKDLDKNTVDFIDNYDASETEPSVLPSKYPNLLVNGAAGIAVGMATKIPPHNLGEVIDATIALMNNQSLCDLDLMEYVKGPDFPTGGIIIGLAGLKQAYTTGRGSIVIRAKTDIVPTKTRGDSIIITEIPYMVNKTTLIDTIAYVVKEKLVDGITDLRDESNRKGMRIVIETRKDANAEVILNNLYRHTQLQSTFGINMVSLVDNKPVMLTLKKALNVYIKHQVEVLQRKTQFDLDKAQARMHILEGLLKAIDFIDEVINIIRQTNDGTEKEKLIDRFEFSDIQAQAILDMQLKRLSGINREKTSEEYDALTKAVTEYNEILESDVKKYSIIKSDLTEIKDKFNDKRMSEISLNAKLNKTDKDLIANEDVVLMVTQNGYAKRMRQDVYKNQSRGGVGVTGIKTNDADQVEFMLPTKTHDSILFFTNLGRVYSIDAYEIPEGSRISKGMPLVNIIEFLPDEKVAAIASTTILESINKEKASLFFATKNGIVKRTLFKEFSRIRKTGIIAISLMNDDELMNVQVTDGNSEIILAASNGNAIRFKESSIRTIRRDAYGVIGMRIPNDEKILGLTVANDKNKDLLIITDKGYAKRSNVDEYRLQERGGLGVRALSATSRNGKPVALKMVDDKQDMIITTDKGMVIRVPVDTIRATGRNTQGVKVINLKGSQNVMNVAIVDHIEEEIH